MATIGTGVFAFFVDDGARLWVASGAFGIMWWSWDIIVDWVVRPVGDWLVDVATGGRSPGAGAPNVSVDHRIAVLERRLRASGTQRAHVQAALRLAELYELQKRDRARAREIIENARARFPQEEALAHYERRLAERDEAVD